jgi:hypothetical protein
MRRGTLSGVVSGRQFLSDTLQDPAKISAWEKSLSSLGINPVEGLFYEAWPSRHVETLEGQECLVFYLGGIPHQSHPGPAVLVETRKGRFAIHGSPRCQNGLCIAVADRGEELFKALKAESRVKMEFKM